MTHLHLGGRLQAVRSGACKIAAKEGFFSYTEGRTNLLPQHGLLVPLGGTGPSPEAGGIAQSAAGRRAQGEAVVPAARGGGAWHAAALIHTFTTRSHQPPLPGKEAQSGEAT